jgi:hypothetical protein
VEPNGNSSAQIVSDVKGFGHSRLDVNCSEFDFDWSCLDLLEILGIQLETRIPDLAVRLRLMRELLLNWLVWVRVELPDDLPVHFLCGTDRFVLVNGFRHEQGIFSFREVELGFF